MFDLSFDNVSISSPIDELLTTALDIRFPNKNKKKVIKTKNGYNFACPFCGDSDTDDHKKRGNLFLTTNTYKCYNCGYYCSQKNFFYKLKDYDYLDYIPSEHLKNSKYIKITESVKLDNLTFLNFDLHNVINDYGIDKDYFKEFFSAEEVSKFPSVLTYLKNRNVFKLDKFLWKYSTNQLIILNIDESTNKILSYETRQFSKTKHKYLKYTLKGMYGQIQREFDDLDENLNKLETISIYHNILNADLTKDIIYTEGAIDSSFFENSISLGSVSNKPPFELDNCKYILDFDKPGFLKMKELLKDRNSVFLWTKFLKKYNIPFQDPLSGNFKYDVNDIVNYCYKNGIDKINWNLYFSNDPMDLIYM
jgi:predicted RNA-binding Zn-ribbon protein involved in translation (DUF1610 family)